jgi:hypothetical protein
MTADHICSAARMCRDGKRENGKWKPAVIEKPRGFCQRCATAIKRAYRSAAKDYALLESSIGDKAMRPDSGKVSGTPEPPMPLNGTIIELQTALSEYCEASLRMVAAQGISITVSSRQKSKGHPVKDLPPIIQASKVIPAHLDSMIEAKPVDIKRWDSSGGYVLKGFSGTEAALAVWRTHQQIESVIGTDKRRTRLAMPCPVFNCGRRTLGIDNGQSEVNCTSCGGRWSDREYQWLSNLLIEDIKNKESNELLNWLLAEANWKLAEAEKKLAALSKVSSMTKGELEGIEGWAVAQIVKEIIE